MKIIIVGASGTMGRYPTSAFTKENEMQAGQFAIFYPEDVHAPQIGEGPIKKLVVKVKL